MCIGIPMKITETDGLLAWGVDRNGREQVKLSLVGPRPVGGWVLSFLGSAREILSETAAMQINAALDGLEAVNRGEFDFATHFPDFVGAAGSGGEHG